MRCFVAIELSPELRAPLLRLIQAHHDAVRGVRWCSEAQLHVTLRFFGDVPDPQVPALAETLASTAKSVAPFDLTLARCGAFPGPRQPRVLWCGVDDPSDGCRRCLAAAEAPLRALGFPPEERPFTAHVTLARAQSPGGSRAVAALLPKLAALPALTMRVEHLTLFESILRPSGAEYRVAGRALLAGA